MRLRTTTAALSTGNELGGSFSWSMWCVLIRDVLKFAAGKWLRPLPLVHDQRLVPRTAASASITTSSWRCRSDQTATGEN